MEEPSQDRQFLEPGGRSQQWAWLLLVVGDGDNMSQWEKACVCRSEWDLGAGVVNPTVSMC